MRTRARAGRAVPRSGPWLFLATLLTLSAMIGAGVAWGQQEDPPPPTSARRPATSPATAPPTSAPVGTTPAQTDPVAPPTRLTIEAIDVAAPLVSLGLNADETVEVPTDPDHAGWYRLGPAPGSPGSAVVLGHVDSVDGPAVFARLRTLERGAAIVVAHADGSTSRFLVRGIATYANADFPAARVYRNHGTPTLTLVTCGGAYDAAKGGYQANVVVTAGYVGGTEPAPG